MLLLSAEAFHFGEFVNVELTEMGALKAICKSARGMREGMHSAPGGG
jgi:hypothetical protein